MTFREDFIFIFFRILKLIYMVTIKGLFWRSLLHRDFAQLILFYFCLFSISKNAAICNKAKPRPISATQLPISLQKILPDHKNAAISATQFPLSLQEFLSDHKNAAISATQFPLSLQEFLSDRKNAEPTSDPRSQAHHGYVVPFPPQVRLFWVFRVMKFVRVRLVWESKDKNN